MATTDVTREALDFRNLHLPPALKVLRLDVEDFTDHDGEASLRINAIVDESVDPSTISGRDVTDFKMSIGESLRSHGISLFPYVFMYIRF